MRQDLLALTTEDLELLSNRGTVKRSAAELESGSVTCLDISEDDKRLTLTWSDNAVCRFDVSKTAHKATCTCDSVSTCRHIIRSIIYYQKTCSARVARMDTPEQEGQSVEAIEQSTVDSSKVEWSPALISDDDLASSCTKGVVDKAKKLFKEGQTVELLISAKPIARFLSISHCVRFMVPGDVRYALCDCRDQAPCIHAVLAVLAFRQMPAEAMWATISTNPELLVNSDLLRDLEQSLCRFIAAGLHSHDSESVRLLLRSKSSLEDNHYYFLVEIIEELLQMRERYLSGDALFASNELMALITELVCRMDGAQSKQSPIPAALMVGGKGNKPSDVAGLHLLGLGTQAIHRLKCISIVSYFQDIKTGSLLTMVKEFPLKPGEELVDFCKLAAKPFAKNYSLAHLGVSSVMASSGRLTASRSYLPGRSPISVTPQSFKWETIKAPVQVESFAEINTLLATEFPWYLGLRSKGQQLRVCRIYGRRDVFVSKSMQRIYVQLQDQNQENALLEYSYKSLAHGGFESLLAALQDPKNEIAFVSGIWSWSGNNLTVQPIAVIFERDGERFVVQPDVDRLTASIPPQGVLEPHDLDSEQGPKSTVAREVLSELGYLVSIGFKKVSSEDLKLMDLQSQQLEKTGSLLLARTLRNFLTLAESGKDDHSLSKLTAKALELAVVGFVTDQSVEVPLFDQLAPLGTS